MKFHNDKGHIATDVNFPDSPATVPANLEVFGNLPTSTKPVHGLVETPDQLIDALALQAILKPIPLGEAFVALDLVSASQVNEALRRQKEDKSLPLGQILINSGMLSQADLQSALVRKMGYPLVDLKRFPFDLAAISRIPLNLAMKLHALPLLELPKALVVAMPDPLNFKGNQELEFCAGLKIIPVMANMEDLLVTIVRLHREIRMRGMQTTTEKAPVVKMGAPNTDRKDAFQLAHDLTKESIDQLQEDRSIEQSDSTLVNLINSMIKEAFTHNASDIHIEPYPERQKVLIRFRIDGVMRHYLELPMSSSSALVGRVKIMCDLDISERRKPQDGKINFSKYGGFPLELRVATIPTNNGLEDVVMRLLASSKAMAIDAISLSAANVKTLDRIMHRPSGLFLCVGPTGSGKTTTLHAALGHINNPDRKIWTAEDPVEITQTGLRQIQVNPKIGWTFAAALRSLLRADPDVIMVGEIRDQETAGIAIEAALTGHLVLSTLHTNSAAETIVRLIDLGVDPFSFADSLQGILAQRLVRRLCPKCVTHTPLPDDVLVELIQDYQSALPETHKEHDHQTLTDIWTARYGLNGRLQHYHAPGCAHCADTGLKGRVGLHELMSSSTEIRQQVQHRARPRDLQAVAITEGMRTLRQDGIEKVLAGITTLAEVRATTND
ncbi:MAG: ATPase, T2SS/T4P/T4SS family [Rhodoferax sp.]|uniref:GspE/PulE family protein n=1 Tax=Rhodoferax sp. TaxID=50421 RepID=UPI003C773EC2